MASITLHQIERYPADRAAATGPVPEMVTDWSFAPPGARRPTDDRGPAWGQALDTGVSLTIDAPEGAKIRELASGTPALYLPGSALGIEASAAVSLAREGRMGLSLRE